MEEFANKEIEITDKLASLIGGDLVTIEFNTKDKSKLEFLLCANQEEKQKVTKKKVKRFKKEIDNCREEIAGYLLALADIFENGQYYLEQEEITKNFISDYYDDLVKTLAKENNDISNLYDLEDIITSNGYDYQLIVDYIFGVSNMYFYQYYKLCLDTSAENATPESTAKSNNITNDKFSLKQTYSENFSNDPLFDDENEYNVFKNNFIEEYNSKLAAIDIDNSSTYEELKAEFQLWEMTQKENLNTIFLKMIKELNNKKTFFFGCSFSSYEHNYPIRLNQFLENFYDATELEFINDELVFLENILYDIQNSESAHDGYSQSGIRNFLKAYDVISITGYRQYLFSHNKKVEFLELRKNNLNTTKHQSNGTPNLIKEDDQNDILKSTIDDYLEEFKDEINNNGYQVLVNALFDYFSNGTFPILTSKINFKSINKKRVGWALKELYKSEKTVPISFDYISFARDNINLFTDEIFEKHNFRKSNLYKIFTTNPAK